MIWRAAGFKIGLRDMARGSARSEEHLSAYEGRMEENAGREYI